MANKNSAAGPARTAKSALTRERILDAAAKVLSRKGYSATRLTDIAEMASIQAPAIYYYFPSREDLIEEVMTVGIVRTREHTVAVLNELPDDVSPLERICAAVAAYLRQILKESDYATAAIRNAGQLPERIRHRQLLEQSELVDVWRELFRHAEQAGALRADLDPQVARMLVVGALNWATTWWNPKKGSLDTVIETAQSIVRNGLSR